MKICRACGLTKPLSDFYKRKTNPDGFEVRCKPCYLEKQHHDYDARRAAEGLATPRRSKLRVRAGESEKVCSRCLIAKPLASFGADKSRPDGRFSYCKECKSITRARSTRRVRETRAGRIAHAVGNQVRKALASRKDFRTFERLGYTVAELRAHLEAQFEPWMTWANYGAAWHIDHRRPVSSFMLEDEIEVVRCWSLANLRPLAVADNLAKYAKIDTAIIAELPDELHPAYHVIFGEAA